MQVRKNTDDISDLTKQEVLWHYCGIDAAVTRELFDNFKPNVEQNCKRTYEFEMAMLGPAFSMMRRGLRVDKEGMKIVHRTLRAKESKLGSLWQTITHPLSDGDINPASGKQCMELLYGTLGIPTMYQRTGSGGSPRPTLNRAALERIIDKYPRGKLLARILLTLRDLAKKLQVCKTKLDPDGRLHTSFKVAGTNTWRWSSSSTAFRTGTNMQNITKELRRMYVPDPGYKFFYADLDQAESLAVAYLSEDENYIAACESPDLHTAIAKQIWPDIVTDRDTAELPYLHGLSYRDLAKRAGHATNYGLTPGSLQNHLNLKLRDAWKFHLNYIGGAIPCDQIKRWHDQVPEDGFDKMGDFGDGVGMLEVEGAFPGIRQWHKGVLAKLYKDGSLTTPLDFTRRFWGNPAAHKVIREAIAFVPQSTIACLLHIGMYRVWRELDPKDVQILCNVHDAILGQIREEVFDECIEDVLTCMRNPIPILDRTLNVPVSVEVGYNWSPVDPHKKIFADGNPDGLG